MRLRALDMELWRRTTVGLASDLERLRRRIAPKGSADSAPYDSPLDSRPLVQISWGRELAPARGVGGALNGSVLRYSPVTDVGTATLLTRIGRG